MTNLPDRIHIPGGIDINLDENKTWSDLQRPQFVVQKVPEAPYLLRGSPANDILLSRLGSNFSAFSPTRYPRQVGSEWGLELKIRQSWTRLEKGLDFISDILLSGASQDREYAGLRAFPHWRTPMECGYRQLFATEYAARRAIITAREAFFFLAARCSLAIALWQKPGDQDRAWIAELTRRGVPSLWIDVIQTSVISRFDHCLRVGAFVDPLHWRGAAHLAVMRRSNLPIFILWGHASRIDELCRAAPELCPFAPPRRDAELAYMAPPLATSPNHYMLYNGGEGRPHPFKRDLGADIPRGRRQKPRESCAEFITRMEQFCVDAAKKETTGQRLRRLRRQQAARSGQIPPPWVPVYLWAKMGDIAYTEPGWAAFEIRCPVASEAVAALWDLYTPRRRYYNYLYDEWDLLPEPVHGINIGMSDMLIGDLPTQPRHPSPREAIAEELDLFYPSLALAIAELGQDASMVASYHGVHTVVNTADDVDYKTYAEDVGAILGLLKESLDADEEARRTYAGWLRAMLDQEGAYCAGTRDCWDLDDRCPHWIGRPPSWRHRLKVHLAPTTSAASHKLYIVTFAARPADDPQWILAANAATVLYIVRNPSIVNNVDAARALCEAGLPFHTLKLAERNMMRWPDPIVCRFAPPRFRRQGFKPTKRDYDVYQMNVLNFIRQRPLRAALMGGGVLWRIVQELLACDPDLKEDVIQSVVDGPSSDWSRHATIVATRENVFYVDDQLMQEEENIIVGTYTMYTGKTY